MDTQGNIVIVDDNPNNLQVLSQILESAGYKVRPALTAAIALRSIESLQADLILLDVCMPEMDGFEACRQLKKNPNCVDLPVIFVSALNNIEDRLTAFQVGGADYILKPFHADEVLARVKAHIGQSQTRRQLTALLAQRELALQKSEARYRALLNDSPLAVMMYEANTWSVIEVNSAYATMAACPAQSLAGKSLEFALGSAQAAQLCDLTEQLFLRRANATALAMSAEASQASEELCMTMHINPIHTNQAIEFDARIKAMDYPYTQVCMVTLQPRQDT